MLGILNWFSITENEIEGLCQEESRVPVVSRHFLFNRESIFVYRQCFCFCFFAVLVSSNNLRDDFLEVGFLLLLLFIYLFVSPQ